MIQIKKDYIYIGIILLSAFIFMYAYHTKPVPIVRDTRTIDSLRTVITQKDTLIVLHQKKYDDLKTAIQNRTRPDYKPVPISERNSAIIDIATK